MTRAPLGTNRPPRRVPPRTASGGRLARPGRPPRRGQPRSRLPILALTLVFVALVAAAVLFWQGRAANSAARAAQAEVADAATRQAATVAAALPTPSPTIAPSSTPTPRRISQSAIPGSSGAGSPPSTPTPSTSGARPIATPAIVDDAFDSASLAQYMLELVNSDRAANGLDPVAWEPEAAVAGQAHAEEMAGYGYMSHWNLDGYGPEFRYSRAGGLNYSQENVYKLVSYYDDGRGAPIDNWPKVIEDAQAALMGSPGHRRNILAPEHTHVGVGIAYNPTTGTVSMAQEFVNQYVEVEPLAQRARPGDRIVVRGNLLPGSTDPLVNLAYEPFPQPLTLAQLNETGTYTPAAEHRSVPPVRVSDGNFIAEFTLDAAAPPGLYHVLVWVASAASPERVPAVNAIIEVQG